MSRNLLCIYCLMITGCSSLEGDWSGEMECEEQTYFMDISVKSEGRNEYVGTGAIDDMTCFVTERGIEGFDCEYTFEIVIKTEKRGGRQNLDLNMDNCGWAYSGGAGSADCGPVEDADWDGKDAMSLEFDVPDGQLEELFVAKDCDADLVR